MSIPCKISTNTILSDAIAAEEMDEANQELRVTIKKIWPLQAKKVLDLIIPPDDGSYHSSSSRPWSARRYRDPVLRPELNTGKLTVGKVYGGLLILENWKLSRFGQGFNNIKHVAVSVC